MIFITKSFNCFVFLEKNLYVATVAGFTGADPLIYREPLRTEQFNPKHLNGNYYFFDSFLPLILI